MARRRSNDLPASADTDLAAQEERTDNELSAAEDALLVTETKAGNRAALDQLIRKHYKWVYSKAYRMLQNPQDAEEVTQDVWVKVWQKLDKWDTEQGSFQAWLNTVARNTIIDAIRKRDRIREHPVSGSPDEDEQPLSNYEDPAPGPEQQVINLDLLQKVEASLDQVTNRKHRIAWMLRHLEEYSIAEIARILDTKEGTVKIWIFRCSKELRTILIAKGVRPQDYGIVLNKED